MSEIANVEAALARTNAEIWAMADEWERGRMPCCPSCAFGVRYTKACDKAERQSAWLVVLLFRRKAAGDAKRIVDLGFDSLEACKMAKRLTEREVRRDAARKVGSEP